MRKKNTKTKYFQKTISNENKKKHNIIWHTNYTTDNTWLMLKKYRHLFKKTTQTIKQKKNTVFWGEEGKRPVKKKYKFIWFIFFCLRISYFYCQVNEQINRMAAVAMNVASRFRNVKMRELKTYGNNLYESILINKQLRSVSNSSLIYLVIYIYLSINTTNNNRSKW